MHVIQIPTGWYGGIDGGCPILFDVSEMEEAARNKLNVFLAPSDGVADKVVKVGDPAAEVLQFAEQNQVDLVVMPTHGYGKFRNLLLGSVTAKVLHDAKCPVWTAAHTEDPAVLNHFDCKDVIGAIDLTPESAVLIRRYAELAREFNAKLRLVHAVPGANPDTAYSLDFDFRHFLLQAAREKAARLQAEAGTNLEVCLEGDAVSKVVRAAALHHDADLVLLGRGTMPEKFGQLRTNSCAIIRDAPCPILSV